MIEINRLRINLSSELEWAADEIAELVAHELAAMDMDSGASLDQLRVPDIVADPAMDAHGIAVDIARSILGALERELAQAAKTPVPEGAD